ncbi:MAG: hypothetical protein AMXMBFR47_37950 [Planctomycetota bacterium]
MRWNIAEHSPQAYHGDRNGRIEKEAEIGTAALADARTGSANRDQQAPENASDRSAAARDQQPNCGSLMWGDSLARRRLAAVFVGGFVV